MLGKIKLNWPPTEPLLVGVSGGADSVALLDALVQLGYRPHVCHLNHQWRGADSDADAEFVKKLAGQYGLPVTIGLMSDFADVAPAGSVGAASRPRPAAAAGLVGAASPPRPAGESGDREVAPTEERGRRARFAFFESVAARTGIHTLALAHTADDQAETFLMRLIRGAGLEGLAGMAAEKQIGSLRVVRPMLTVTRAEVVEYLRCRQLTWREDASNADRRFLRNRIRHELLPLLERDYNPAIREVLWRTAEILRAEAERDPVAAERRAIRELVGEVSFEQVEAIRQLKTGDEVTLPGGVVVYRDYDGVKLAGPVEPLRGRWPLKLSGETKIAELGVRFVAVVGAVSPPRAAGESRDREVAPAEQGAECFDADALGDAPFVRTWEAGDRFQPLGMKGEKKLQDFFVDEKVPRRERGRVPLLCATDGRIAWVVGYRIAEPFKVTERTRRVLSIAAHRAER